MPKILSNKLLQDTNLEHRLPSVYSGASVDLSFCFSGHILITYTAVSTSTEIRVSAMCPRQLELITGRADESTPKRSPP